MEKTDISVINKPSKPEEYNNNESPPVCIVDINSRKPNSSNNEEIKKQGNTNADEPNTESQLSIVDVTGSTNEASESEEDNETDKPLTIDDPNQTPTPSPKSVASSKDSRPDKIPSKTAVTNPTKDVIVINEPAKSTRPSGKVSTTKSQVLQPKQHAPRNAGNKYPESPNIIPLTYPNSFFVDSNAWQSGIRPMPLTQNNPQNYVHLTNPHHNPQLMSTTNSSNSYQLLNMGQFTQFMSPQNAGMIFQPNIQFIHQRNPQPHQTLTTNSPQSAAPKTFIHPSTGLQPTQTTTGQLSNAQIIAHLPGPALAQQNNKSPMPLGDGKTTSNHLIAMPPINPTSNPQSNGQQILHTPFVQNKFSPCITHATATMSVNPSISTNSTSSSVNQQSFGVISQNLVADQKVPEQNTNSNTFSVNMLSSTQPDQHNNGSSLAQQPITTTAQNPQNSQIKFTLSASAIERRRRTAEMFKSSKCHPISKQEIFENPHPSVTSIPISPTEEQQPQEPVPSKVQQMEVNHDQESLQEPCEEKNNDSQKTEKMDTSDYSEVGEHQRKNKEMNNTENEIGNLVNNLNTNLRTNSNESLELSLDNASEKSINISKQTNESNNNFKRPSKPIRSEPLLSAEILYDEKRKILTHYIDGYVIYESDKPFPTKNGMSIVEAALFKACNLEASDRNNNNTTNSKSLTRSGSHGKSRANHSREETSCQEFVKLTISPPVSSNTSQSKTHQKMQKSRNRKNSTSKTSPKITIKLPPNPHELQTEEKSPKIYERVPIPEQTLTATVPDLISEPQTPVVTEELPKKEIVQKPNEKPQVENKPLPEPAKQVVEVVEACPENRFDPSKLTRKIIQTWGIEEVVEFVKSIPGCASYSHCFQQNEIDGEALLLLSKDQFISPVIGMKIGPALKLSDHLSKIN